MKHYFERLRLIRVDQLTHSVNGNPRWQFSAETDDGQMWNFKTASSASSAFGCNLNRLENGDLILARYHQTAAGTLIVDKWDDSHSSGINLSFVFAVIQLPPVSLASAQLQPCPPLGQSVCQPIVRKIP